MFVNFLNSFTTRKVIMVMSEEKSEMSVDENFSKACLEPSILQKFHQPV